MQIIDKLLDFNKMSRPGTKMSEVRKITIHWVGNAGSTAIANRNYFNNLKNQNVTYASSHYIVGLDGEIIRCVPENEVAYHGNNHNSFAIGIENCHPDLTGRFNDKTYKSLCELCVFLLKKYDLGVNALERHYDITGKICPKYYVEHKEAWEQFKKDVKENIGDDEVVKQIKAVINGKERQVNVIEKEGVNYIKLRDLQDDKIAVGYSNGMPTLNIKG